MLTIPSLYYINPQQKENKLKGNENFCVICKKAQLPIAHVIQNDKHGKQP